MDRLPSKFRKLKEFFLVLLALAIAAAASFLTYSWQHSQINSLNSKVSSLKAEVNGLNNQLSVFGEQVNKICPSTQRGVTLSCSGYKLTSEKGVSVLVFTPNVNSTVSSPIDVIGEIPGSWSFEAQFPVQLRDSKGDIIARATANLLDNWTTPQLVPFYVRISFSGKPSGKGAIVLVKDNPSGLQLNSDSVSLPINFSKT